MNITEQSASSYNWDTGGVYQIEVTDPVQGGAEGIANKQAKELALRTRNLHNRLKQLEIIVPDEIINTIRGTVSEDLDTLQEIIDWVGQQLEGLDTSALANNIITTIRGGVATDYDTLAKLKNWIETQFSQFKGKSELSHLQIDWNAEPVRTKTLTAATTLAFLNLIVNKTITLIVTGNFALTLPSSVKKITGEYDGTKSNLIQLLCTSSTIGGEEVWCVISQPES